MDSLRFPVSMHWFRLVPILALLMVLQFNPWLAPAAQAAVTIVVTTNVDANAADSLCSLREAIQAANTNSTVDACSHDGSSGIDTITFNIAGAGPHTISPSSALPSITDPVIIDGTTEPSFTGTPVIELNGVYAPIGVSGLHISAGGSTVRGLVINRFPFAGIRIGTNGNNTIEGNYIGTDVTGTLRRGNLDGVSVSNTSNNRIGGVTAAAAT